MAASKRPHRKVSAAGLGGAASVLVLWLSGLHASPEQAAALATACSFLAGYIVSE